VPSKKEESRFRFHGRILIRSREEIGQLSDEKIFHSPVRRKIGEEEVARLPHMKRKTLEREVCA